MTDDLAELRAKIRVVMALGVGAGYSENYLAGRLTALRWVLSLLPPPPPKYEVKPVGVPPSSWWQVRTAQEVASEFNTMHYPDAEQRARDECARLNGAARNEP
jgi:hypothetical protein